jgi:DNA-binding PadR family transcriptional regulator
MKGDHLGEFEELVLLAVRALGAEAYGVSVRRVVANETRRSISLGSVYAALDRLEKKGLLRSRVVPGTAMRGGRSRRAFQPTAEAARTLETVRRIRDRLYELGPVRPVTDRV